MFSLVYVLPILSIHGYCSIFLYLNFDPYFYPFSLILIHSFFYRMHSSIQHIAQYPNRVQLGATPLPTAYIQPYILPLRSL